MTASPDGSIQTRFGLLPAYPANVAADPTWMVEFARHAETVGFESIYIPEHIVVPAGYERRYPYSPDGTIPLADDCPFPDPLELLSFLAAVTERIVLATGVLLLPAHHPVLLAKRAATLDALSGGRLRLGVGVGWMREELDALDSDFHTRGARADEMIAAMRVLWTEDEPTFHGSFFSFERARCLPRPVQPGGVPIHIGGHTPAAARRAGRMGDGFQPLGVEGDDLDHLMQVLREAATAAGRDAEAIELTLLGVAGITTPDDVKRAEEQGATRLLLGTLAGDLNQAKDELSRTADLLIHA